jgi:DNA uptake protein ComE-like DNA-binding protein
MKSNEISATRLKTFLARSLSAAALCPALVIAGCASHPSDEQIKQQAAETTQQVKQGAEQAAADAKIVAAKAEDKINAVAAGVKQGLRGDQAGAKTDLNSANRDQLLTLPGITPAKARRIIDGRPYATPGDLVSKGVLSQNQLDRIADRVKTER